MSRVLDVPQTAHTIAGVRPWIRIAVISAAAVVAVGAVAVAAMYAVLPRPAVPTTAPAGADNLSELLPSGPVEMEAEFSFLSSDGRTQVTEKWSGYIDASQDPASSNCVMDLKQTEYLPQTDGDVDRVIRWLRGPDDPRTYAYPVGEPERAEPAWLTYSGGENPLEIYNPWMITFETPAVPSGGDAWCGLFLLGSVAGIPEPDAGELVLDLEAIAAFKNAGHVTAWSDLINLRGFGPINRAVRGFLTRDEANASFLSLVDVMTDSSAYTLVREGSVTVITGMREFGERDAIVRVTLTPTQTRTVPSMSMPVDVYNTRPLPLWARL